MEAQSEVVPLLLSAEGNPLNRTGSHGPLHTRTWTPCSCAWRATRASRGGGPLCCLHPCQRCSWPARSAAGAPFVAAWPCCQVQTPADLHAYQSRSYMRSTSMQWIEEHRLASWPEQTPPVGLSLLVRRPLHPAAAAAAVAGAAAAGWAACCGRSCCGWSRACKDTTTACMCTGQLGCSLTDQGPAESYLRRWRGRAGRPHLASVSGACSAADKAPICASSTPVVLDWR